MRSCAGSSSSERSASFWLVLALECIEVAQPCVPVGVQRVGDQAVVRIDLQVAPAGQFGLIAGALQLRAARRRGLLDTLGDLLLHGKRCRRHRLQQ